MNLASIDFFLIKKNVLFFGSAILISVAIIIMTNAWLDDIESAYKQQQSELNITNEKLLTRQQAQQVFQQIKPDLSILSGFSYDKVDKLKWLEYIQRLSEQLSLPMMTYQIKARQPDDVLGEALQSYDETVYVTPVEFQAGLLHDGQLLQLLEYLNNADLGLFSVEHCEIAMQGKVATLKPKQTNLTANCRLDWYEVDKKVERNDAFGPFPDAM